MSDELLYSYDGYLKYAMLSSDTLAKLRQLFSESGLAITLETQWLEFTYSGKDSNRKIVTLLGRVAPLIKESDGEIICRVERDAQDFWFEFYTIHHGRLYRQVGNIVKGEKTQVSN